MMRKVTYPLLVMVACLALPGGRAGAQVKPLGDFEPPAAGPEVPPYPGATAPAEWTFGRIRMPVDARWHPPHFLFGPRHGDLSSAPETDECGPGHEICHGHHNYVLDRWDESSVGKLTQKRYRGIPSREALRLSAQRLDLAEFDQPAERPWALGAIRRRGPRRLDRRAYGRTPSPSWYVIYGGQRTPPPQSSFTYAGD